MKRHGSAPNFCPPEQEGRVFSFKDEKGDTIELEFLGLIIDGSIRYGFFFPTDHGTPDASSGEVMVLEVTELDADGQPVSFELVDDPESAQHAYEAFKEATKDLYSFE
ncbi:MAG: DUF1292 domain-containing protein [Eggerthellaceae bacterium]|jgi:hypothetical protein|nr:DUF1292 domain-containing protein [Eggerthellaceae bacterium]MCH4221075.1 DUF1292 domain-containing protein [Eggerthellaceae bacterium]